MTFDVHLGPVKSSLRRQAIARRDGLPDAQHAATARALADALLAPSVALLAPSVARLAAYVSIGTEPGTGLLRDGARTGRGPEVLLPVLLPDGDLDWALDDGVLVPGPRGLLQPAGPRLGRDAVAGCDLVLVPALAVDGRGTRLGRGGGSYDRALLRATSPVVAALHPGELVERLPCEPHDRPVDAVLLADRGLVRLRDPGDGLVPAPAEIAP